MDKVEIVELPPKDEDGRWRCAYFGCDLRLTTSSGRGAHMRVCNYAPVKVKKYKCQHCDHRSAQQSALLAHMRSKHQDKGVFSPFQCLICYHRVGSRGALKKHMNTHPKTRRNRRRHGGVKIIFEVQMNTKWMSQVSIGLEDGQKRLKLWDYREYSQHYNVRLKERHFTHLRLRLGTGRKYIEFLYHPPVDMHVKKTDLKDDPKFPKNRHVMAFSLKDFVSFGETSEKSDVEKLKSKEKRQKRNENRKRKIEEYKEKGLDYEKETKKPRISLKSRVDENGDIVYGMY